MLLPPPSRCNGEGCTAEAAPLPQSAAGLVVLSSTGKGDRHCRCIENVGGVKLVAEKKIEAFLRHRDFPPPKKREEEERRSCLAYAQPLSTAVDHLHQHLPP
nr:hypothetical protein Iba_chr06cCG12300 [Ipomoea batatas]